MDWLLLTWTWLYIALVLTLLVTVLLRKPEPASALAWSLAIVFLPGLGPLLFLLVGANRVPRYLRKKMDHRADFGALPRHPKRIQESGLSTPGALEPRDRTWIAVGAMLEALGEGPRRGHNRVALFNNAQDLRESLVEAIESAKHHIHLLVYILRDDRIGKRLIDLLIRKVKEGVEVRVLVDGIGSWKSRHFLRRVRRSGARVATFLPLLSPRRASPNLRNHRKIIICDGRTGFFGGMNVGEEYLGQEGETGRDWYDLHMRVDGPSVWDLQRVFAEDWDFCAGETLDDAAYFPEVLTDGNASVQMIAGGPDVDVNPIRQAYFNAFVRARRSIHIATPYLVPDRALLDALRAAAFLGVEVHLVTQSSPPDSYLVYYCGLFYAELLAEAGVRIYEYPGGMMHAKAVAVDAEWAMLGTANLDNRSMFLNFEQMGVFDGKEEAQLIESELRDLVARSREITLEQLQSRATVQKVLSKAARLFAPLL